MTTAEFNGVKFSDTDVANPNDFIPAGECNPHNVHPFLIHDNGFAVAVVFASNLQDALDIAADTGKLDWYLIGEDELADYGPDGDGIVYLGNACEPFDIEPLSVIELPNPKFSFVSLFCGSNAK